MPSHHSSPEIGDDRRKLKKKRHHRSISPCERMSDNRGIYDERSGHRKHDRERHTIKIEPKTKPDDYRDRDHSRRRSRSPVRRHGDGRPTIKHERQDPGYSKHESGRKNRDAQHRRHHDQRREQHRLVEGEENWGESRQPEAEEQPKDTVNFGLSGKLTEETNTFRGVVIKYNEPPEARKPKKRWRLYPFKGDESLPVMHIHRQSAFLFGRDRKIADLPVDHPSCSKQHAVLQYRLVEMKREDGRIGHRVKPYIIDLGSANGTYVNNQRIDSQRYVELMEKDVIKFGFSSREYVLLHDNVKVEEEEDEEET